MPVVQAEIADGKLHLYPQQVGASRITVTATDYVRQYRIYTVYPYRTRPLSAYTT